MDLGIAGKTALITGGGRGIGRACAVALAAESVRVLVCSRTQSDLHKVIEAMGGEAAGHAGIACDLLADDGPEQLMLALPAEFCSLDIVIHNLGGTLAVRDAFAPLRDWRRVWRANLEVMIELNALFVPQMLQRKWGRLVAISSAAGSEHQGALAYAVAKAGLNAYVRGLGRELAASGVVVSAVAPGTVRTDGGVWDRRAVHEPDVVEQYIRENVPAGALQRPEQVADVVAFLCSDRASQFAGSVVPLDAGQNRAFVVPDQEGSKG